MDTNKLEKLREINYQLKNCCGTCVHSQFNEAAEFGVCKKHIYEHQKHTDKIRLLSIYRYGKCDDGYELKINTAPFLVYFAGV